MIELTRVTGQSSPEQAGFEVEDSWCGRGYVKDLNLDWAQLAGKDVLDVGAAGAEFARDGNRHGVRVVSCDLLNRYFDDHPEWPTDMPFVVADGRRLPFADQSFDFVVAHCAVVLMVRTWEDARDVLSEATRVLRPGGEFRFGPGGLRFSEDEIDEWRAYISMVERAPWAPRLTFAERDEANVRGWWIRQREQAVESLLREIDPTLTRKPGKDAFRDIGSRFYYSVRRDLVEARTAYDPRLSLLRRRKILPHRLD